jgi:hypothetical protein
MFRFTIRDVLWLMVVVGMGCAFWIQLSQANRLRDERTLWKTRAIQLKGQVEGNEDVETTVEFLPTKTNITFGKYREDDPATRTSDENIIKVMADENAALKEKIEVQRKLIETYEAERQAISNAVNPA